MTEVQSILDRVAEEFRCGHDDTRLRYREKANGIRTYVMQCQRCGEAVQTIRKSVLDPRKQTNALPFQPKIRETWFHQSNARWKELYQAHQQAKSAEWWNRYQAYLVTPAWQQKRKLVLERARGICEGCAMHQATQVHHLTYERVTEEMLFDLVAICDDCHEQVHGHRIGEGR